MTFNTQTNYSLGNIYLKKIFLKNECIVFQMAGRGKKRNREPETEGDQATKKTKGIHPDQY